MLKRTPNPELKAAVLVVLENCLLTYGFNVVEIASRLGEDDINIVIQALHSLLVDGKVRRTPNTLKWRLS